jgi:hypothetical protein
MKRLIAILMLLAFTLPAMAIVNDGEAMYLGGTAVGVKEGVTGKFDATSADTLNFVYNGGKLEIPYARVTSFEYSRKLARHLGVVPTIAVVMVKHLQRRHFFTIDYKDDKGVAQSVVFEVSKDMPQTLEAVLRVRAPRREVRPGSPCYYAGCQNYVPPCSVNNTCGQRSELSPAPQAQPTAQPNVTESRHSASNSVSGGKDASVNSTAGTAPNAPTATHPPAGEFPEFMRWDD